MTKPVRVVLVSGYPSDHASFAGGVETATAALLEGLRGFGAELEVHVVASGGASADVHEQRDGVGFHFLAGPRHLRPRFPFRALRAWRMLRSLRPDLVHCQDTVVLALAAVSGRWSKVFTVHGIKGPEASLRTGWERWSSAFEALLQRRVQRRFDAVVCNSAYSEAEVGTGVRTARIPNAVAPGLFRIERGPRPHLLFVGALTPLKRPGDLLDAHAALLGEHPDLRTSVCGPVEDRAYAAELRRAAPAGVEWEGLVDRGRLGELLASATALVLPSLQENVPMVIAEAMAAGVPVVATRVGGIPEMVADGVSGLLYEPGDAAALRDHLHALLTSPDAVARMGDAGRRRARELYSPVAVATATVALYRELLGSRT